jgi:arylsulfatase A-like enzyme
MMRFLILVFLVPLLRAKPNVLVIITDDQGWGDIGYHNPKVYTPNLDRLANESATFTQHYVTPQCTPTRLALLTGRYPGRFGPTGLAASNDPVLPHGTLTLASLLKQNGYRTYLTGKWHLGSQPENGPNHHGFDSSYGALAGAVGAYNHQYKLPELNHPYGITWHRDHKFIEGHENGTHVTDLLATAAIKVIKEDHDQPYFLYLPFFAPHTPLDERGQFPDQPTQLDPNNPTRWLNEDKIKWFNDPNGLIQSEPDPEKRLFLAVVHHVDYAIGEVLKALDGSGQRENTLIFFSSDNGPQVNWSGNSYPHDLKLTKFNQPVPFRGSKCDAYEGGIRVPGLINWRGKIAPKKVGTPVHIIDWLPTVAAITGSKIPDLGKQPALDGYDLSPLLFGTGDKAVMPDRDIYTIWNPAIQKWALRHGNWKIVKYGKGEPKSGEWQLYHLGSDQFEKINLAGEKPEIVQGLHSRFLAQRARDRKSKASY